MGTGTPRPPDPSPRAEVVGDVVGAGHYDATIADLVAETRALAARYDDESQPSSRRLDELARLLMSHGPGPADHDAIHALGTLCRQRTAAIESTLAGDPVVAAHARTRTFQGVVEAARNVVADYEAAAGEPAPEHYDDIARRLQAFLLLPPDDELVL